MLNLDKFSPLLESISISSKVKQCLQVPYAFQSATQKDKDPSSFPLVVALHAMRSNTIAPKAKYERWNYLHPFDCYGYRDEGSFWAVGYPNWPLLESIVDIVNGLKNNKQFNGKVYVAGASSSGIAAVRLAKVLNAEAVYLNVPVLTSSSVYKSKDEMLPRYEAVFGDKDINENALTYLEEGMKTRFHIVDQRFGFRDFVRLNSFSFVQRCLDLGINVHYELLPTMGHSVSHTMRHVLGLFSKYPDEGCVLGTGFPKLVEEDGLQIDEVGQVVVA